MEFSVDFFKDEVRNGFYIPTAIKQAWAANLLVLDEIDRICEKHNITYFADWGSMLGAVRHGGYVPWDDDLDICMKRDDYIRFREVAAEELTEGFAIHDYESKENHWLFLARVVNQNRICFEEDHLKKFHNFPYISAVDIFIQDYLYRDEEKEFKRCTDIKRLIAVADGIAGKKLNKQTVEQELSLIEKKYCIRINRRGDAKHIAIELYKLIERQMARVPENEADCMGQIFPWILKGKKGLPKEYYEQIIRLPFENTTIPVPAQYDQLLRSRYGNYLQTRKVWTGHNYPYFESQRNNLQAVADFDLPEYRFSPEMLNDYRGDGKKGDSLKEIAEECILHLDKTTRQIIKLTGEEAYDNVIALLPQCQQLAVDLGTLVEKTKGSNRQCSRIVVTSLQEYCDALYGLYLQILDLESKREHRRNLSDDDVRKDLLNAINILNQSCEDMNNNTREYILERNETVFIAIGPKEWVSFDKLYREAISDGKNDVYVIPLPVLFKDALGRVKESDKDVEMSVHRNEYPAEIEISSWRRFNMQMHHPEHIYIQNPYDGENPCLTVPPQYYAKNLLENTELLTYVPAFNVDEFDENDYCDVYNMKHYVTAPGVIYADEVLVQSDNMKRMYVEKLSEFAGEETKEQWEGKIRTVGLRADIPIKPVANKRILYLIGIYELFDHGSSIIDKLKERFETFRRKCEMIEVTVCLYPYDMEQWESIDKNLRTDLMSLINSYQSFDWCSLCDLSCVSWDELVKDHSAYYGSVSPLLLRFRDCRKPVMIASYDI